MNHSCRNHIASSMLVFTAILAIPAMATAPTQSDEYAIGVMVKSLDNAIKHPSNASLATIAEYGTDSRYYVMIRGWLVQELQGVKSQLAAYNSHVQDKSYDANRARLQQKVDFLQHAIRRIDLE
ncbi:hypothetical protein L2719_05260 [Shewanella schlegeliana]|uniref:Uncharacterized protein n=1 Tax=Shewanella schlegeliana TaxID=190308 RepID=A0ABS1SWM5_9GAMM|nr:hypothetical protein [Shewanella schlegeliana]MBL4912948.1 hypothetical protein [Shewanella schlegeliana]MCL1108956.1 hypothetical protein [Shewanella schlegeliana]GIU23558.1 hypothetical protein TUM4433_06200 [Shewanella schlegeliana]